MTMPTGEPTLAELARTLSRIETDNARRFAELAAGLTHMVTRDLYEAHRTSMQEDIGDLRGELKAERERKAADRRMVHGALLTAVLSLAVAIVGGIVLFALKI